MRQQAIVFKKINASVVANSLSDFTAQELLDEYDYMLNQHLQLILVKNVMDDGVATLSHVVTASMFLSNAYTIGTLNDRFYIPVVQL